MNTAQNVLDAYRADAQVRALYVRELERENRKLRIEKEIEQKKLELARIVMSDHMIAGGIAGYGACGLVLALDNGSRWAQGVFLMLAVVGVVAAGWSRRYFRLEAKP